MDTIDSKVLATIRAAYKWALKDHPDAEVCPNCHGSLTVKVNGESYPCPCQDKKPTPAKAVPQVRPITRSQIATSNAYRMDVALESLTWHYDDITTQLHGCVLGMTGSGKTNTVYRIVEQILHAKGTVTIVDPEGDYRFLKSQFPILIAGKGRKGNPIDLVTSPESGYLLARKLASRSVSIILDLSGYDEETKNVFVQSYVGELWKQYQDVDLPPMRLVIDEVQLFSPQNTNTDSKKPILDIASRGRKRHLALLIATQRPQRVDKTLLDATDIRVFHRLKRGSALNAVRELLPFQIGEAKGKEIDNIFANMLRGQATFEMEGQEPCLVTIKPSDTYHPQTGPLTQLSIPLATLDADLIAELKKALAYQDGDYSQPIAEIGSPRLPELEAENQRLCNEVLSLRKMLEDKEAEIAALKTVAEVTPVISADIEYRSPLATARVISKQRREFGQLINSLTHQHSGAQRAMLKFLIQNDANVYNLHEIARFSGYSVSTLSKLPQRLIAGGYIWRQKGRKPIFQSTVRSRLAQLYPDLNTEGLIGEILKACK
jgi:hypothetical protein